MISGGEEVMWVVLILVNSFFIIVWLILRDIIEGNDFIISGGEEGIEEVSIVDFVYFMEWIMLWKVFEGRD